MAEVEELAQQRILNAALQVFAEAGFRGATTREIARRAKVHQPALAYHYRNKEKLWRAAADAVFGEFSDALATGLKGVTTTNARLNRLATVYIDFVARKPEWAAFIIHEGMQTSARGRWLAETWLGPQTRALYKVITASEWPRHDAVERARAISAVGVLTGSALVFAVHAHISKIAGVDPREESFVERHALTVFEVLKSLHRILGTSAA